MTAGKAEDVECAGVLRDVWLFLDDEMNPRNRAALEAHLDGCEPCLEEANLDSKLKALLHSKCGGDMAPAQLRDRLVARLHSVTVTDLSTADGERLTVRTVATTEYSIPDGEHR